MREKAVDARWVFLPAILFLGTLVSCVADRHPTVDRVPPHAQEKAINAKAPFGDARNSSPKIIAMGKTLFEGKARCVMCHGESGKGDGPAANMHNPPPRNFTDCEFQKHREDGELFWVIKHGSPGTGMPAMIPHVITEEEGWQLVAYVRSFCKAEG